MARIFIAIAAILGALSVAGGAFASHALKSQLRDRALEIFERKISPHSPTSEQVGVRAR
jgi:uncharacterized membrane protein YgdD (TMEM256/DUF423 family)